MRVFVKAKAGSKIEKIEYPGPTLWDNKGSRVECTIWVKEPAVQGRANTAITAVLSQHFKVPKSQIALISGFSSKNKVFEVST